MNKHQQPESGIHEYTHPLSTCVANFNFVGLTTPQKSATKTFNVWKLERKKNEEIMDEWAATAVWFQYTRYIKPLSKCVPIFNFVGLIVPEKSATKSFNVWKLERKKNEEIKDE